jgi:hypothetical protein
LSAHLRPTQDMRDADSFMVRKIGVSNRRGSGAAGISIVETVLNGDADQISDAPRPQLGLDLAAVVRGGLVADTEGAGDLGEAAALRQKTKDF